MFVCFKKGANNKNEDTSEQQPHDSGVQSHDGALVQPHDNNEVQPHNGDVQAHDGNIAITSYVWIMNTYIYFQIIFLIFVVSMAEHEVEDARREEENMPTNPMVLINTLGK